MTEENLPKGYEPSLKKEQKLPSKKRWSEMVEEMIAITPDTDPTEAFRTIAQIKMSQNPHIPSERRQRYKTVEALRQKQLQLQGLNSDEWAYYTSAQPNEFRAHNTKAPFTELDMERWSSRLPKGLELFVIQGEITPGSEYTEEINPIKRIDHFWEIYVRIKPIELSEG